jgi:hypothetical protein
MIRQFQSINSRKPAHPRSATPCIYPKAGAANTKVGGVPTLGGRACLIKVFHKLHLYSLSLYTLGRST